MNLCNRRFCLKFRLSSANFHTKAILGNAKMLEAKRSLDGLLHQVQELSMEIDGEHTTWFVRTSSWRYFSHLFSNFLTSFIFFLTSSILVISEFSSNGSARAKKEKTF